MTYNVFICILLQIMDYSNLKADKVIRLLQKNYSPLIKLDHIQLLFDICYLQQMSDKDQFGSNKDQNYILNPYGQYRDQQFQPSQKYKGNIFYPEQKPHIKQPSNDSMQVQHEKRDQDGMFDEPDQFRILPNIRDDKQEDNIIQELFNSSDKAKQNMQAEAYKKQMTLQQSLQQIQKKISQVSTIQNKISGLKSLSERIRQSRSKKSACQFLCNWIQAVGLIKNFIHQDTHFQILRNVSPILKFLYENNKISIQWLFNFVFEGLRSPNEEFIKLLQSLLNFVKIQDLDSIFSIINSQTDLQNPNLSMLLTTIVGNKYFIQQGRQQKKIRLEAQKNVLLQFQQQQKNLTNLLNEAEIQKQKQLKQNEEENIRVNNLTLNLFKFLIQATQKFMNIYYPILNKLISSKQIILQKQLSIILPQLLKKQKVNSVWILQHCLKIDFGQGSKQKKTTNQARFNFISKLVNQHLYQHILIILAKHRFNKIVVDKILNILILLSKNYKPLEQNYTKYIWKILGLHSKEEKEREQFFIFVKDILRYQSNFTQESVHFIFFQVLMELSADWFSLKILDCFEMLFMRLNQDLKLITYTDQTYLIEDPDLVGIDKFWYIYFNSNDLKVTKKCKDFLWKIGTYNSNNEIKEKLLKQFIQKIIFYMTDTSNQNIPERRIQFCNKGFDIIDKMMEQIQKKQQANPQQLQLVIQNYCRNALPPKKIHLKISQKSSFSNFKQLISLNINPPNSNINLICQGKYLKDDKKIVKELPIKNKNTIMVTDQQELSKQENQEIRNQWVDKMVPQLIQIFGDAFQHEILKFVVSKMEGNSIQAISDAIIDEDRMASMKQDYEQQKRHKENNEKKNKESGTNIIDNNKGIQQMKQIDKKQMMEQVRQIEQIIQQVLPTSFSQLLSRNQPYILQLLQCASHTPNKKGWQTLKSLPKSPSYLLQVQKQCEQQKWAMLFPKQQINQMMCLYNAHMLKHILQKDKDRIKIYLFLFSGFDYLIDWVRRLPPHCGNVLVEEVMGVLVLALREDCARLGLFRQRLIKKKQKNLFNQLMQQQEVQYKIEQYQFTQYGDQSLINWLICIMLNQSKNQTLIQNLTQTALYFILNNKQIMQKTLQLPLNQVFFIIKTHGFVGQYLFIAALAKFFTQADQQSKLHYCRKYLELAELCFGEEGISDGLKMVYVYDFLACILDKIPQHSDKQLKITTRSIQKITQHLSQIPSDQLISILELLKLCFKLNKTKQNMQQGNNSIKIANIGSEFCKWLINQFLFNIQKPSCHIRDKSVRKVCYGVLAELAEFGNHNLEVIIQHILGIQVGGCDRQDDFVEFRTHEYLGLVNLGATCYINSLLQQLYHTEFSKLIIQHQDPSQNLMSQQPQIMQQLKSIFIQLQYSIKNSVNPKRFISTVKHYGESINPFVQQDASEFLLIIFDHIQNRGYKEEVYDVFGGFLCNQITVEIEEGTNDLVIYKNNMQHFNSLTLDIKGKKNLQQALAYFIKPQMLDGQNKYFHDQLGKKVRAASRFFIQSMPNILILTLKRFQYDIDSHTRHKLNDYFQFPLQLDLHKYSAAYLRNKEQSSDSKYKLTGIVVHSGSAESGHYYSYIKIGELWYQFNDKVVTQFNFQSNLKNQCFGCTQGKKTKNAYILFYQKSHTNYHGAHLNQIPESNSLKRQIKQQNQKFLKSRLIYDDNFRTFLESIEEKSTDTRLRYFIDEIFQKKEKEKEKEQQKEKEKEKQKEKERKENEGMMQWEQVKNVYFDAERNMNSLDDDFM